MGKFVETDKLFGDDHRALLLCEHICDLSLLRKLIEISDKAVSEKTPNDPWTYEGICFLFARSIVSYAKMAYDNIILGYFDVTNMLIRVLIENNVCLELIHDDESEDIWKYYLVQSYRNSIIRPNKEISEHDKNVLGKMYIDYNIDRAFTEKRGNKKAYIELNYGWTYKINQKFTFEGLCELVGKSDYSDFKMMSMYSHGTDIYLKFGSSVSIDRIMSLVSSIYIGLYRMITLFCWDCVDESFDDVTDEIECIIYRYINEFSK